MMRPSIRLGFVDYFSPIDEFFIDTLSQVFDVVRDDANPEYLIFCDENFGIGNLQYDPDKVIKIFFTGENRRPWDYKTHYAIGFDHLGEDWFYRLPLYVVDNWVYNKKLGLPDIRDIIRDGGEKKTNFCSFVVRNGACPPRNAMFHRLSEYKKVDSGGPWLNNIGGVLDRNGENFHFSKLDFLRTRKFNLCYENGSWPGYVTEKLYQALYCNTVPIYWGSPTVEMDFNPKAFISRHAFESDEQMITWVKQVDSDWVTYNEYLRQPIVARNNRCFDLNRFNRWFQRVVYKG